MADILIGISGQTRKKWPISAKNQPEDVLRRPCPPGALLINVFFGLPSDKNDIFSREFKARKTQKRRLSPGKARKVGFWGILGGRISGFSGGIFRVFFGIFPGEMAYF